MKNPFDQFDRQANQPEANPFDQFDQPAQPQQIQPEQPVAAQPAAQPARQYPMEALPLGLQDYMLQTQEAAPTETIIGDAVKAGAPIAPEIAGGIYGGMKGHKAGRTIAGPLGGLVGGAIGGITGSMGGKQVQSGLGLMPEQTVGESAREATKEEAAGRLIASGLGVGGRIAAPLIKPITTTTKKFLESMGMMKPNTKIEDLFINSSTFNPSDINPRNIIDAQENLLNERLLTTFEETGGKADALRAAKLSSAVTESRRVSDADSAFMNNREVINKRMKVRLKPDMPTGKIDKAMGDAIKDSFNAKLKSYNPRFKELETQILPLRGKVRYNAGDAISRIQETRNAFVAKLPEKDVDKIFNLVQRKLKPDPLSGLTGKSLVSARDLKSLDNEIESLLPQFSESKNVQSQISGLYAGNIKPILQDIKAQNAINNPTDDMLKLQGLESEFARLAEEKGRIVNSKVGELIGLAEGKQLKKSVKPRRMADIIFESPDTWEQTKAILKDVNPEMIPIIKSSYKARIAEDVFKEGDVSSTKITNILKSQSDAIKDIGGKEYLRNLEDAQQISYALEKGAGIGGGAVNPSLEDKIATNFLKTQTTPLQGRVGLFGALLAKGKKGIGLGSVSDKDLFGAMQGKRGQTILENMTSTFLDDPTAYNTYVQFVREINKLDNNAKPLSRGDFESGIDDMLNTVLDHGKNN